MLQLKLPAELLQLGWEEQVILQFTLWLIVMRPPSLGIQLPHLLYLQQSVR